MTSEQPQANLAAESPTKSRRLRRRETDRVIAGVAGGVADYLNVDPLLLRAGFAGLMIFGGAGLVLYVAAWLFIPGDGRDESIIEEMLARFGFRFGRLGMAVLVFLAVVAVGAWLSGYGPGQRYRGVALIALAIIALGILLLRGGERLRGGWPAAQATTMENTAPSADALPAVPAESMAQAESAARIEWTRGGRPEARPRERSPLAWYVVAATLVAVGLLALVGNLPGLHVTLGQYLGAVLAVVGLGLVAGAWWGRARPLILLGLLLLPVALASAFVTVPLEGGIGELEFRPQTIGELRPEYRLAAGDLRLDLTDLSPVDQPVSLSASVGVGQLIVIVPSDARVQLEAKVGGGRLSLFGNRQIGTGLADRVERPTGSGPNLILTLETGLGGVSVQAAPAP